MTGRKLHSAGSPSPETSEFTMLVDRERELRVLSALVRDAYLGTGGIALVEGPAGIGKSLLLDTLVTSLHPGDQRVLRARCDGPEPAIPFGVVRQLFSPLLASLDRRERARLLARCAHPARQALLPARPGEAGAAPGAPEDVSYLVLSGLYRFVWNLAERNPLVFVVDDAHRADLPSLRFLAHLAHRIEGLPVVLALAQRSGDEATDPALLDELAAQPLCRVLRPRALTPDGIGQLVRGIVGQDAGPEFNSACLSLTGGNPLLVRSLLSVFSLEDQPLTVEGLRRATRSRDTSFSEAVLTILRKQPGPTLAAVSAMVVMGEGAAPEMCARLAGLDEAALVSAIRTLRSIGLVTATEDARTWSFNHGLVPEVIIADMDPDRRAEAHRNAARLLVDSGAQAEQVAGHLLMSEVPATEAWAVIVLREAAQEAFFRGEPELAANLLRHCLHDPIDTAADVSVLVELGLAEAAIDAEASVRHLRLVLEHVSDPVQRFKVLRALSGGLVRTERSMQAVRLLGEQAGTVRDFTGDLNRVLEAHRLAAAYEVLEGVLAVLSSGPLDIDLPGDTPGERALLATRAVIAATSEDRAQGAAEAARRALRRSDPGHDSPGFLTVAATVLLHVDRPDEAYDAYQRIVESCRQEHRVLSYGLSTALQSEAAYRLGALCDAVAAGTTVLELMSPEQWGRTLALPVATRIHTLLELGDLDGASAVAMAQDFPSTALETWEWNTYLCARGRLRLARDEPQSALVDLLESGRREHQWGHTNPALSSWWVWAGRAHLVLEDSASARALAEEAVARARRGNLLPALGAGLRLLAETESGPKRLAVLEEALAVLEQSPARLELARVLIDHGSALHASGHTEAARQSLRRGLELSYTLGASVLRSRAHDALLATGARPRRPAFSGLASLTPSEVQVARLAAAGGTNREISQALFVTRRTVELHLTSVYRKLGVSGRRELRTVFERHPAPGERETLPAPAPDRFAAVDVSRSCRHTAQGAQDAAAKTSAQRN